MFRSISTRISYIVAIVVIASTLVTLLFTGSTLEKDMTHAQGRTARNTIRMGLLYLQEGKQAIERYREHAYKDRRQAIKDVMDVFISQIDSLYGLYRSGKLTEQDAKEAAYKLARETRFFNNDYFFIYTDKMFNLAHPDRSLEGRDLSKGVDKRGYAYGPDMIRKATREGGGYVKIWWTRLGDTVPIPKILYVKGYPKWGWIIGTGAYADDIEAAVDKQRQSLVMDMRKGFSQIRLAETGRLFIFDNEKNVLVPPVGAGPDFAQTINLDTGKTVIHDLKEVGKLGEWRLDYKVRRRDGSEVQRQSFVRYFAPMGWYVASTVPMEEIYAPVDALIMKQGAISFIILLLTIGVIYYAVRRICLPIRSVSKAAFHVSRGDLRQAKKVFSMATDKGHLKQVVDSFDTEGEKKFDEVDYLVVSIHTMLQTLNSLVSQVQKSGDQVTRSALKLGTAIGQLEIAVESQATATQELGSTSREISATSQELARTMNESTEVAVSTGKLAAQGVQDLGVMSQTMDAMRDASGGIFSKLSVINSKAANISTVVTSISKISEQINLLSLNAAIEAEKAGEFGQGFSVVAREIRKLADQTAMSTLDIEKIVAEMLSAVSSGVMEMDKFRQQVENGVSNVDALGSGISGVVSQISSLTPQFESVNEGMQNQSEGAAQISKAMFQLTETSIQTKDALTEFKSITEQLSASVSSLEEEVAVFQVEKD
ncbi:methyl-accepting chemotaxis protein [Maridesulfovibrio hydrothermalis]|uniref:Methyl-accepting chemotaxis sensory transducer with Cache sensor n=1 Tax=Maridesulfovibrio hydrothermalis AM13 = DSM 14728 TaxID=1121451 RepID=L0RDZ1_9BACT|nr:methyl-accepting chemotaxis protein [Maridesulfovibrio hydrothermalis]CCO24964.1 Methyl-accepting chemotaxis sensory transducer with Cache sensor [Maridesulfovibrio hydrothermalis AM13 = DSM 14728]